MRIGLVGLGRIGAFHAETLVALPAVETLVVTDARADVVAEVAARLRGTGAAVETCRPEDLLEAGIDGLVVATATNGHAEWIRRGIDASVATFCEKPVAGDLDEIIELARLDAASETPVHIGHQRRFDAGFARARDAVASGELNRARRSRCHREGFDGADDSLLLGGMNFAEGFGGRGLIGDRIGHQ